MPATDVEERLAVGLCNIVDGLAALQTLMGRATNLIVSWADWQQSPESVTLPVIAYDITDHREIGGAGDNRRFLVTFACFDREHGSAVAMDPLSRTRHMVELLEGGVSQPALALQGLDAAVMSRTRPPSLQELDDLEGVRRSSVQMDIWITK
jgi:hypothetical protein